jgi:cytosine/adenosine deaminase-related metal-dependent hydrolase
VVTCRTLEPLGCRLEGDGADLILVGEVVAEAAVLVGGQVRVRTDGTIACVGCDCSEGPDARSLTCGASVIAPAFVNPHDHVAYAHQAPPAASDERYEHRHDWRLGLRGHTAIPYEGGASTAERAAHELRMLIGGSTTIAGGAGYRGLLRNPDVSGLSEGLPTAPADSDTFPLDDADGLLLSSGCTYGSRHTTADDVERFGAHLPHLGEGVDGAAHNELRCAVGTEIDLLRATSGVVHAVAANARVAAELGARGSIVVWSPRSNLSLYGNTAPVTLLRRSGVEVALGTDWLLSGSMNVQRELACARSFAETYLDRALADHELLTMSTASAARALGAGRALGRVAPGFLADLQIVEKRDLPAHTAVVTATAEDVELVLRGGAPLYGRGELVAELAGGDCEELDVCGRAQRACTAETGFSLTELLSAGQASYPLFFCGVPDNEPTCVPFRPNEYDGLSTERDVDGDGVADPDDLCPRIFDPVRPFDLGVAADDDGDGLGDACDPCPLEPDPSCTTSRWSDRDRDGITDTRDLCPLSFDRTNADADRDGWGDACDPCTAPNPGVTPCPLPIAALRDAANPQHPPRHSRVEIAGATVIALRPDTGSSRGYYVQDGQTPFSGLFVFSASTSPGVAVGDRLTLRGRTDVYYGTDELVAPEVVAREPAVSTPLPVVVNARDVGDGGALATSFDSMLVRVEGVSVVSSNPDAPSDYDETLIDGALRIDDLLYPDLDNDFVAGTKLLQVTAVLGQSFDHQKLWPRGPNDFAREVAADRSGISSRTRPRPAP